MPARFAKRVLNLLKARFSFLRLAILLLLAGCQTVPLSSDGAASGDINDDWLSDPAPFSAQDLRGEGMHKWAYNAKVGLLINGESDQANLAWEYSDQSNQIRLFGPLGAGAVKLEFDDYGAVLTDSKGRQYRGASAAQLLTELVGWPLPVNAMQYWLFAHPAQGSAFRYQLDDNEDLAALQQLGWKIEFKDWRDYDGRRLPRRLTATKTFADPELGDVRVKVVTKDWQWQ